MKIKYCLLQGLYWMLFCVNGGYVTAYLTGIDVSAGMIGMITAVFCGLSALLQPTLGRLADQQGRMGWQLQLKFLFLLIIVCDALLLVQRNGLLSGLLLGIALLALNCAMPFVNGASFYYENRGIPMNFGVARGCGSLFYAIVSTILGRMVELTGIRAIAVSGIIIGMAVLLLMQMFPTIAIEEEKKEGRENLVNMSQLSFIKQNKIFVMMLLGFMCLLMFHNTTNTYLLQMVQKAGGGSSHMGFALSIAAILEIPVMFGTAFLVRKYHVRPLLILSGIAFSLKGVLYCLIPTVVGIYAAQLLQPFSYAVFASVSIYYAQEVMSEENKLRGQTYVSSAITLGAVFGNLIGGAVLQAAGVRVMLFVALGFALLGALDTIIVARKKVTS